MPRMLSAIAGVTLIGVCSGIALAADDDADRDFEGSIEVLYRNVSQSGSAGKYDEDFDGLDSGARLSSFRANWSRVDSDFVDFFRLEASGLGGDPYERAALRLGRKDEYDLRISHREQTYLYDLFELVGDQDASTWNAQRRFTDIDLTLHATDAVDVFVSFGQVQRDGTSIFLKDINRDLFQLDTPLDQKVKRYSVGGRFALGPVDLFVRQMLRRYDYNFDNTTRGNAGLSQADLATLNEYSWTQNDTGSADLTTLTISAPLGERVSVTATAFGTLLGEEEITSRVGLAAQGTSFGGTCSVTGVFCDPGNPCDPGVPGNVCVADPFLVTGGVSEAEIEADHLAVEAGVSVEIAQTLDFHFQARTLDREVTGAHLRDLDGNAVADDTEGSVNDSTPGSTTRVDYSLSSITGLLDYAASRRVRVRAGYRRIARELDREGFEFGSTEFRNADFESDGDDTVILGLVLDPAAWLRLNADYEEGDIAQAFTAVAPMETDRLRVRARVEVRPEMRIDLSYLDYENANPGSDFRGSAGCGLPGSDIDQGCWNSRIEGSTYSATFWHDANEGLDYWLRWARQDLDSVIRFRFDTDVFFNSAENGDSVYDNTSTEWAGQVNFSWAPPWRGFVRARLNDSTGGNDILGPTFTNRLPIDQDYVDVEVGVTHAFASGLYVGGRIRTFDYDDENDRLDYEGEIVSIVAGLDF